MKTAEEKEAIFQCLCEIDSIERIKETKQEIEEKDKKEAKRRKDGIYPKTLYRNTEIIVDDIVEEKIAREEGYRSCPENVVIDDKSMIKIIVREITIMESLEERTASDKRLKNKLKNLRKLRNPKPAFPRIPPKHIGFKK